MSKVLIHRSVEGELIWFDEADEDEVKAAYLQRLTEQGVKQLDPEQFVIMQFTEHNLANHGGRVLNYDHGVGFHPSGPIPKP